MVAHVFPLASLSLTGALLLISLAASATERASFRGLSLEQAIVALGQDGLAVIYSNALVKPWMRIRAEPTAATQEQRLAEILAPFGLRAQAAPHGVFAVVRGRRAPDTDSNIPLNAGAAETAGAPHAQAHLEEIVVSASQYELTRSLNEPLTSLSGTDIEHLPDIGDDALRAVARLPGAASNGLSARAHLRGGEAGETLVRLDGLRLYNPFHLKDFQSIFSAIDPRIVSSVDVYTGSFSPRFGDGMSGVLDITSLTPPAPRYSELNVSFFNSSVLSSGRFANEAGEWVASLRRSNLDVWYHALRDTPGTPSYTDAFGKVSYRISPGLRATAGTLLVSDEIGLTAEDQDERANADYKDQYHWLRLDHQPNELVKGVTLLSHARLRSNRNGSTHKDGLSSGSLNDARSFTVDSVTSDWVWSASESWMVELGGELKRSRGVYDYHDEVEFDLLFDTPGATDAIRRNRAIRLTPSQDQYALYTSVRYGVTPRLATDVGLRWESSRASPRLGARYQLAPATFVRLSWGRIYQAQSIDEIQVADGVTAFFPPQRADHVSLGFERRLAPGIELRAEVYEKRLSHLRPRYENLLNPLTLVPELNPDRIRLAPTSGRARGVEILLSKRNSGPVSWWLGYTRSSAKERLDGRDVLRSWDQTHSVSAGFDWTRENWSIGAAIAHRSGWPTTAVSLDEGDPVPILRAGARNAERSAVYRSVDLRAERRFALDHSALSVFLEIANVLGRDNPCCSAYEIDDETGGLELERRNYVPRIPSIGFLWQF